MNAVAAAGSALLTPPLSLYVHFPWCVRKCPYCDFNSYALQGALREEAYLRRLERDLEAQAPGVRGREVGTVFFGGGTPSLFSPEAIGRVLESARRHLALAADAEVTLEANPGTIERGAFREYRAAGSRACPSARRASMRRSSKALGRIHSPQETRGPPRSCTPPALPTSTSTSCTRCPAGRAGGAARCRGRRWRSRPHTSRTTSSRWSRARCSPRIRRRCPMMTPPPTCSAPAPSAWRAPGFAQYEVSAYARAGMQCRHNLNYWNFGDYLGVGAGAHGKLTGPRARGDRAHHAAARAAPLPGRRRCGAARAARSRRRELPFEFMLNALRLCAGFAARDCSAERTGLAWSDRRPARRWRWSVGLCLAPPTGLPAEPAWACGSSTTRCCSSWPKPRK